MHSYSMTLREFGSTPTRDLLMLFEDIPRIQAGEALLQTHAVIAGMHPKAASEIIDHWQSIINDDPEDDEPPPKLSEEEYQQRVGIFGLVELSPNGR